MSEETKNTADMARAELEEAATSLDIKFPANIGDDTLRAKINEALGNPNPANPDSNDTNAAQNTGGKPPKKAKKERRFEIIATSHERDKQPVQVGVNGRMYIIERGKKVIVPESVVKVLETAVRDVYEPETMEKSEIGSYGFQVVREV